MTAAYELTRTDAARAYWDVEIFEMGHRFGGRLASHHRNSRWHRNEEHGLHVWFGFYDNTFRLAEQVWKDWQRPPGCPWTNVWDALRPIHFSDHALEGDDGFEVRRLHHPRNAARPGAAERLSLANRVTQGLDGLRSVPQALWSLLGGEFGAAAKLPDVIVNALWPTPDSEGIVRMIERALAPIGRLQQRIKLPATRGGRVAAAALVDRALRRLHAPLVTATRMRASTDGARELVRGLDLVVAATRGLTSPEHGIAADDDLDRISGWELRDWLRHHGACDDTLEHSHFLDALYDIPFAYVDGDRSRPVLEAGTAMRFALRMLTEYKHAIAYLLAGGSGEILVAPLYELLEQRGVRFRPFHRLNRMEIDPDRTRVKGLGFVRQARVRDVYQPLVTRDGLRGFHSEPDWSQLVDGDPLRLRCVDFYSRFGDRGETAEVTMRVDEDFDDVILALPFGCIVPDGDGHTPVAGWLEAFPLAQRSFEKLHLVPTVAAQLWLREAPDQLGFRDRAVVTWSPPYSVVCDMSPVITHERWPSPPPQTSAYLCGAWPLRAHRAPSSDRLALIRDQEIARRELLEQLEHHGHSVFSAEATLYAPSEIDDPLDAQYMRANAEPWDLADLALPGCDANRLEAAQSGMTNLALAGTWVRNPINTTCLEAAVASGIAAARALGADVQPIFAEAWRRQPSRVPYLPGRGER
jgi:uncharacterized protein with NAD-binding domain and iron-sulfur cluster